MTTTQQTCKLAAKRLEVAIAENRVIRKDWTREEDGRQLVCLLAALSPEVAKRETAEACPADLMPEWLAHLTPWIDDTGSEDAWPAMIHRYADLVRRWHVLTDEDWTRLDYACRAIAVREAMTHAKNDRVIGACDAMISLLDRAATGDRVSDDEWADATGAADAAGADAAWAAVADAAEAAAEAAADAAAADRMTSSMMGAIEAAIVKQEGDVT